jgi:hypothetical protein
MFQNGDRVQGTYHNVPFDGVISSWHHGTGIVVVSFSIQKPTIYGTVRDRIVFLPDNQDLLSLRAT